MDTPRKRFEHVAATMHAEGRGKWKPDTKPSFSQLGPACFISKSTLTNYVSALERGEKTTKRGKDKSPDTSTIDRFEAESGFRWQWVMTGEGPERTSAPALLIDEYGSKLFDGVIKTVMDLAERVMRHLKRQPEYAQLSEEKVRQTVLDALFLDRKIRTELELSSAATRLLNAQSGERKSASFRAAPTLLPPPQAPDTRR